MHNNAPAFKLNLLVEMIGPLPTYNRFKTCSKIIYLCVARENRIVKTVSSKRLQK